jgi:hypothetical protein
MESFDMLHMFVKLSLFVVYNCQLFVCIVEPRLMDIIVWITINEVSSFFTPSSY